MVSSILPLLLEVVFLHEISLCSHRGRRSSDGGNVTGLGFVSQSLGVGFLFVVLWVLFGFFK